MPSYNISIEFDITCDECGYELEVTERIHGSNVTYITSPCTTCMKEARDEAYKEGYDSGYESGEELGYTEGHREGYKDGQDSMEDK